MTFVVFTMLFAMLIPLYQAWKDEDIWQTMVALSSFASKASVVILVVSVLRDDWMVGVAGVIIMSVGNAGFMLLAQILKRMGYSNPEAQ